MDEKLVRRITPLSIREDFASERDDWVRLGCGLNATGAEDEVIGITTGSTHWIYMTRASLECEFGAEAVAPLVGRTIAYVYVTSIEQALALWPDAHPVSWSDTARAGTRKVIIDHHGKTMILAEKLSQD